VDTDGCACNSSGSISNTCRMMSEALQLGVGVWGVGVGLGGQAEKGEQRTVSCQARCERVSLCKSTGSSGFISNTCSMGAEWEQQAGTAERGAAGTDR
jgi:hypothetical protein